MNDKQQLMALGEELAEGCFAWRNTAAPNGFRRYMTDKQYQRQTAGVNKWYEPYRCANCREAGRATTQRQRDELLAALEALVKIIADTPKPDPDDVFATIDEARSVINRVRGEIWEN